ncbi:bacterio-opsin activator domain-containing protein [Salinilacihabitans rarus]|uniref:bacterio-opsin activator domain-containing protein n=1 Tax=Salinilacihabitans rarus TaxID=2961596 RepID=UPI0020C8E1C8|nr:bacterio-opsin activator domain-containing protein [Salinilacihabitans rarus]
MSDRPALEAGDVVRVLVVGDTERAAAATGALESRLADRAVLRARTVPEALAVLDEREVRCILFEFDPDDSGAALLERLREAAPSVPAVALADDEDAAAAVAAGADDVLAPDAPPAVVVARVGTVAERRRLEAERESASPVAARAVLEAAAAPVFVLDRDGDVRYASPAVADALGHTPGEVERRPFARLVHRDDRADATGAFESVVAGGTDARATERLRLSRADGAWRVAEATYANRLADPAVEGVVVTVSTPAAGAAGTPAALDRLDAAFLALGPDWGLREVNAAAADLLDAPADDLVGTVLWDRLPGSVRGRFHERLREARETASTVAFEVDYPGRDERLAVEAHPGEDGVSVLVREAPAADAAAREARERAADLEAVVDALDAGVFVIERETVAFANERLFAWCGADALVGREATALFDEEAVAEIRERARSRVVRLTDPVEATLAAEDGPRRVSVAVTPLPGEERAVCVVRDAAARPAAESAAVLERLARRLRAAETGSEVGQAATDAVRDGLAADVAGCYAARESELRPVAVASREGDPVDLPTVGRGRTPLDRTLERGEATVHDGPSLDAFASLVGERPARALTVPVGDDLVLFAAAGAAPSGTADLAFLSAVAAVAEGALARIGSESRLESRDLELARTAARLDRLRTLGERIREIHRLLVDADSRADVERGVCDALAALEWVDLAWIGEVGADGVSVRAASGDEGYLESVAVAVDPEGEPAGRAAATGAPTVVDAVARAERGRGWRRVALDRGLESVLAVPLAADGAAYGVLALYANRPLAFDADAVDAIESLGRTVAHGITAIGRKRALVAETVTELEFVGTDIDDPLPAIARAAGRRLELRTVVPRADGGWSIFAAVDGDPDPVREAAADLDGIDAVDVVAEREDGSTLEVVASGPTLVETLADRGAALRSIAADADGTRFVVEVPPEADVRSLVDLLDREYPGTDLLARRERERPARTARSFDAHLRERLTDRQLRALEAAYYGGFFEWPRERTGEEVAASLGVSQPTFNRHLRTAERKLYALLFEGDDPGR